MLKISLIEETIRMAVIESQIYFAWKHPRSTHTIEISLALKFISLKWTKSIRKIACCLVYFTRLPLFIFSHLLAYIIWSSGPLYLCHFWAKVVGMNIPFSLAPKDSNPTAQVWTSKVFLVVKNLWSKYYLILLLAVLTFQSVYHCSGPLFKKESKQGLW